MYIAIFIFIGLYILYLILFYCVKLWIRNKVQKGDPSKRGEESCEEHLSVEQYNGDEDEWEPVYNLEHHGLKVFNIPFVPEENEVFYIENEYDEEANLFIQENMDLIKEILATRGLTFVYLPSISISREMAESMVAYYTAGVNDQGITNEDYKNGLRSDFLLDYMFHPEHRQKITHGFAWYNTCMLLCDFKKLVYVFDYISFDGAEARKHPKEVLEDMLPELCSDRIWRNGLYCERKVESHGTADDNFDEETQKILTEIQERLNSVRLKGVSEAIIAQYVQPCPKLSRISISKDFNIKLIDYDTEIVMEPIVKAVFILFLRHEEGIYFKELADYQTELEIIYRAIKAKNNDIDYQMNSGFTPQISDNIKNLANPLSNSINEKCTRIKEAFIIHFHDSTASNYYVDGFRASKKTISIPRELVIWED